MRLKIELDSDVHDIEVIIKAAEFSADVALIKSLVEKALAKTEKIIFYKNDAEYFIELDNILFFETDGSKVFAHTADDFYEVKHRLYELENIIPSHYCRISKSAIINLEKIYSLEKSFSGSSTASFLKTEKTVHISRHYYKIIKDKLHEIRR